MVEYRSRRCDAVDTSLGRVCGVEAFRDDRVNALNGDSWSRRGGAVVVASERPADVKPGDRGITDGSLR